MYQDYFGFSEMPFHVTPNPRFLFLSPTHHEALQHLRYGIENRKGFIVLTGEVLEVTALLAEKGALTFGLSDKPDEGSVPSAEASAQGAQPLHRVEMKVIGTLK